MSVNDLISRSALANLAYHATDNMDVERCVVAWEDIEDAPAVDAVEVVRCKDCKHYMTIHCTCDGCCVSDYWFCADGERRNDV